MSSEKIKEIVKEKYGQAYGSEDGNPGYMYKFKRRTGADQHQGTYQQRKSAADGQQSMAHYFYFQQEEDNTENDQRNTSIIHRQRMK